MNYHGAIPSGSTQHTQEHRTTKTGKPNLDGVDLILNFKSDSNDCLDSIDDKESNNNSNGADNYAHSSNDKGKIKSRTHTYVNDSSPAFNTRNGKRVNNINYNSNNNDNSNDSNTTTATKNMDNRKYANSLNTAYFLRNAQPPPQPHSNVGLFSSSSSPTTRASDSMFAADTPLRRNQQTPQQQQQQLSQLPPLPLPPSYRPSPEDKPKIGSAHVLPQFPKISNNSNNSTTNGRNVQSPSPPSVTQRNPSRSSATPTPSKYHSLTFYNTNKSSRLMLVLKRIVELLIALWVCFMELCEIAFPNLMEYVPFWKPNESSSSNNNNNMHGQRNRDPNNAMHKDPRLQQSPKLPRGTQQGIPHPSPTSPEIPRRFDAAFSKTISKKKTLVLDLDETLVHSTTQYFDDQYDLRVELYISNNGSAPASQKHEQIAQQFFVYKRPYVDEFLMSVSKWYNIVIFTASVKEYADPVINALDKGRGIIQGRYFRESCGPQFAKDLSIVDSDLANIIIIDNSPQAYAQFHDNAIPIDTWYSDQSDDQLKQLITFLKALRNVNDVRSILWWRNIPQLRNHGKLDRKKIK